MKALFIAILCASTLALAPLGPHFYLLSGLPAAATIAPPADSGAASMLAEIGAYEKKFFERSFDGESSDRRLDRLDTFIFGATNSGSAQVRIAKIAKVVPLPTTQPAKPATTPSAPPVQHTAANTSAGQPLLESPGHYPHITALEGELLGNTYENQPLPERLSRLEVKVFGAPSKSNDLEERTDAIDKFQQAKRTPKELSIGNPMFGYHRGASPEDLERRYESADEDPASFAKHEAIEQELADAQKTTPPTTEERTLSRIAWCEQQIFGHAFPEMHLLQRLHQLNADLFPNDHEKDIQLMDRIDIIVKEVVLRKQPHQPSNT